MSDAKYDKVKNLVEVDDDILAVFTILSGKENHIENLSIAENANITKDLVIYILAKLQDNLRYIEESENVDKILGHSKWRIIETDRIRILIIYEKSRAVIVLIKSNTSLSETVDNILGYYYESENPSKDFF
jgi:hypothetical protein